MKITVSNKSRYRRYRRHNVLGDELIQTVKDYILKNGKGFLIDKYIGYTGDDIHIIMSHTLGTDNKEIHKLAWTLSLKELKLQKNKDYMEVDRIY